MSFSKTVEAHLELEMDLSGLTSHPSHLGLPRHSKTEETPENMRR